MGSKSKTQNSKKIKENVYDVRLIGRAGDGTDQVGVALAVGTGVTRAA